MPSEANVAALRTAGWNHRMAEALDENDHTPETAKLLSTEEAFNLMLEWNGICGFTGMIMTALDNCRNMEAV